MDPFANHGYPPAPGVPRRPRLLNVFNRYLERGGEERAVRVVADSLGAWCDVAPCEFHSSDWTRPGAPGRLGQALRMVRNPPSLRQIRTAHRVHRPDAWLVHNVFPVGSGAIYPEARRLGVPVIAYVHNFRPFSVNGYLWADGRVAPEGLSKNFWPEVRAGAWQGSRLRTAWFAAVLSLGHEAGWWRGVTAWVAISDFMRDAFIRAGIPGEKIFTLRHFWQPRATTPPGTGEHYLFLGRLIEAKGLFTLLDAWRELEHRLGANVPPLVIAGDGPLAGEVARQAEEIRGVRYVGELAGAAKEAALAGARAVVVPSRWWEPLGLVVYEAYDHGKPVLAARSGGLTETVRHGATGYLHAPGDAAELAAQVMALEDDPGARTAFGAAGRTWLAENADENHWREGFARILDYACRHGRETESVPPSR